MIYEIILNHVLCSTTLKKTTGQKTDQAKPFRLSHEVKAISLMINARKLYFEWILISVLSRKYSLVFWDKNIHGYYYQGYPRKHTILNC